MAMRGTRHGVTLILELTHICEPAPHYPLPIPLLPLLAFIPTVALFVSRGCMLLYTPPPLFPALVSRMIAIPYDDCGSVDTVLCVSTEKKNFTVVSRRSEGSSAPPGWNRSKNGLHETSHRPHHTVSSESFILSTQYCTQYSILTLPDVLSRTVHLFPSIR